VVLSTLRRTHRATNERLRARTLLRIKLQAAPQEHDERLRAPREQLWQACGERVALLEAGLRVGRRVEEAGPAE